MTLIKSSLGRFMPIIKLLLTLDIKSRNLNLYELIFFLDVISRYLLSCNATFHNENNNFSEIFSSKFSIINDSFVLNFKKIFSFNSSELICKHDVLLFKIDVKCDFPEPGGPKILIIRFIHLGQLFIKLYAS